MNNKEFAKAVDGLNSLIQSLTADVYVKDLTIERLEDELRAAKAEVRK